MYLTTINLYNTSFSFIILAKRWKAIEIEISSEVCTTYIKNVNINICIFIYHNRIHRIISLIQFCLYLSIGNLSQKIYIYIIGSKRFYYWYCEKMFIRTNNNRVKFNCLSLVRSKVIHTYCQDIFNNNNKQKIKYK